MYSSIGQIIMYHLPLSKCWQQPSIGIKMLKHCLLEVSPYLLLLSKVQWKQWWPARQFAQTTLTKRKGEQRFNNYWEFILFASRAFQKNGTNIQEILSEATKNNNYLFYKCWEWNVAGLSHNPLKSRITSSLCEPHENARILFKIAKCDMY